VTAGTILRRLEAKPEDPFSKGGILGPRGQADMIGSWLKAVALGCAVFLAGSLGGPSARAMGDEPVTGRDTVIQYLTPAILEMIFPGSEKIGEIGGVPPSAAVYKSGRSAVLGCRQPG
jgi:hypothetical protein